MSDLAFLGAAIAVLILGLTSFKKEAVVRSWMAPLSFSIAFFVYSFWTISQEGLLGFWTEHTRNFWGVQIWYDLLLAALSFWLLILPRAKAQRMNLWAWAIVVISSGSIGILLMFSRLLFLEGASDAKSPTADRSARGRPSAKA